jgi:hypothetical protein
MAYPIPTQPPRQGSQPAYPIHRRPLLRAAYPTPLTQSPEPPTLYLPSQLAYPVPLTHPVSRAGYPMPASPYPPHLVSQVAYPIPTPPPRLPTRLPHTPYPPPPLPSGLPYARLPAVRLPSRPRRSSSSPSPARPTCPAPPVSPTLYPSTQVLQLQRYPAARQAPGLPHTTSLTPKSPTLYPPDLRGRNLLLSPAGLPYTAARPVSKTPNNHRVPR